MQISLVEDTHIGWESPRYWYYEW